MDNRKNPRSRAVANDSQVIPPIKLRIPMPKGAGIPAKSEKPQAAASRAAEARK
jgi:hypothetical protein